MLIATACRTTWFVARIWLLCPVWNCWYWARSVSVIAFAATSPTNPPETWIRLTVDCWRAGAFRKLDAGMLKIASSLFDPDPNSSIIVPEEVYRMNRTSSGRVRERFLRDGVPDRLPQIHGEDRDGGQGRVHRRERRLGDDAHGVRIDLLNPVDLGRVGIQDAARVVLDEVIGEDHVIRGDRMTAVRGIHGVREVRVRHEVERPRDAVGGRFPSVREVRDNAERGVAGDERAVDVVHGDELEDKSDRVRVQRYGGQAGNADSQRARCLGGVDAPSGGRGRGIRDGEERRKQDRRDEDGGHDRRNDSSFTAPPTRVLLLPWHNPTSMARGPNTPARATT